MMMTVKRRVLVAMMTTSHLKMVHRQVQMMTVINLLVQIVVTTVMMKSRRSLVPNHPRSNSRRNQRGEFELRLNMKMRMMHWWKRRVWLQVVLDWLGSVWGGRSVILKRNLKE